MEAGEHHHPHQAIQGAMAGGDEQQHKEGRRGQQPPPAEGRDGAEEAEEAEEERGSPRALRPSFPPGRVKRIVKLDREITKVNSEALLLISLSTDLFLGLLAEKAGEVALLKRKRSVRVDHLRAAARGHQPTGDFLLDSLHQPPARAAPTPEVRQAPERALPPGVRRIDEFFPKSAAAAAPE